MNNNYRDIYDLLADFARAASTHSYWANMIELIEANNPIIRMPMLLNKASDCIFCLDFICTITNTNILLTTIVISTDAGDLTAELDPVTLQRKNIHYNVMRWMSWAHSASAARKPSSNTPIPPQPSPPTHPQHR